MVSLSAISWPIIEPHTAQIEAAVDEILPGTFIRVECGRSYGEIGDYQGSAVKSPVRNEQIVSGGEGEIRTHGTREGSTVFETAAFDHSATSPLCAWSPLPLTSLTPGQRSAAPQWRRPIRSGTSAYQCSASPK